VARAAVLFEVAHRLHPDEVDPLWLMGEAWALAGYAGKARAAWTRALERDSKGEYRERIEAGLAKL
jgi:cytochrome c-type biogenesis protein CcmH/NrfG